MEKTEKKQKTENRKKSHKDIYVLFITNDHMISPPFIINKTFETP